MRKVLVSLMLIFALVRPAAAQWAVIDVTNLQQNVMNTISTFTQEYQQIQQYVTQLQQLQYEYMQLKGIANGDVSAILGTVTDALNINKEYQSSLKLLYGDLNSAKRRPGRFVWADVGIRSIGCRLDDARSGTKSSASEW